MQRRQRGLHVRELLLQAGTLLFHDLVDRVDAILERVVAVIDVLARPRDDAAGRVDQAVDSLLDYAKAAVFLATDRPHALRQAIFCVRKGGTVSIPGAYGGFMDKFPIGAAFNKGLTFKMGQTHMQSYMPRLLAAIEEGKIDPSFVISHRLNLSDAPKAYDQFNTEKNVWRKVVLTPQ